MRTELVSQALWMAFKQERPKHGLIHHSDRGSQYASQDYRQQLIQFGMAASMSQLGNCYDNAPMESFWASLKKEQVHHQEYRTRVEARADILYAAIKKSRKLIRNYTMPIHGVRGRPDF